MERRADERINSGADAKMSKVVDAKTALKAVKNGDRVTVAHATGEPQALTAALWDRKDELKDVEVVHMVCMGKGMYCLPEAQGHFRHNSLFIGGPARKAFAEGRADFVPVHFSEIPSLFLDDYLPVDVALVQASRPDKRGHMSLGISVDYTMATVRKAKTVIVQMNKYMPRTHGDSYIHVSDADFLVDCDEPLIELPRAALTEQDYAIGRNCATLIMDGATLQLGIGALPDAVLFSLKEKNDLGIHSEMISDGVMELVRAGVVNCRKKNLHRGKIVATFIMGSQEMYDFLDDNPILHMAQADYVNDPFVIAQNDNMTSINSCVEVDLAGQVCAESVGLKQISATGGQGDFVRGANHSKGGKSIIALPSVTKDLKTSKIVPFLADGATVTTPRTDVRYIVTEFGVAGMFGKNLRQRAQALIGIAHPNFKDWLIEEYEKRFCEKFINEV
jgi:4-hydroxybutyrate CoA-transferase